MAAASNALLDRLELRELTEADFTDELRAFVHKFYAKEDVLAKVVGASDQDENGIYSYRAYVALKYHKASFGFFEKSSGRIVALKFNFIHDRSNSTPVSMLEGKYSNADLTGKAKAVIRFVDNFFGDIFTELSTSCYMESGMTCVHLDYVKHGLATELTRQASKAAIKRGCEYMVSFCPSRYTQLIGEKLGCTFMREVKYDEYVDPETGDKPFKIVDPKQTHARIYFKRI